MGGKDRRTGRFAMSNPFSDQNSPANPYASPASASGPDARANALFIPSLAFLVLAVFWTLYMLAACVMVASPDGPFRAMTPAIRTMTLISYCLMVVVNVIFIAGAVAMIRRRPKWLAWTGCILGLLPIFGPCMGLTIPLGIWCLVLLRRPEVDASFHS
jgi:hypothetical protein